jgi:hypothetical protein
MTSLNHNAGGDKKDKAPAAKPNADPSHAQNDDDEVNEWRLEKFPPEEEAACKETKVRPTIDSRLTDLDHYRPCLASQTTRRPKRTRFSPPPNMKAPSPNTKKPRRRAHTTWTTNLPSCSPTSPHAT